MLFFKLYLIGQMRKKPLQDNISKSKISMETMYKDSDKLCHMAEEKSNKPCIDMLRLLKGTDH